MHFRQDDSLAGAVVMILRVWVLYNKSRFILGALLVLYAIELVSYVADCLLFSTKKTEGA